MENVLKLEVGEDGIAVVSMIKGENRFRTSTIKEWNRMLDRVLSKPEVNGLMITGSGRYFSNGLDLDWLLAQTEKDVTEFRQALGELTRRLLVLPVPTVALINGHAFGVAAFLALACDYRVMRSDRGWLCWPETALRMRIASPNLTLFRAKVGSSQARREALLFSKRMSADTAKQLQFVDAVAADGAMMEVGKGFIKGALGKNGLDRAAVEQMKKDLYSDIFLTISKL